MLLVFAMMSAMLHLCSCEKTHDQDEYCQSETFQPLCLKNEVILMKTAMYGRMRIGKCITKKEIDDQRFLAGDESRIDPRILGCSVDVLPLLDRQCSGKTECQIRVFDISSDKYQPCVTGLYMYLEASYDCITAANEERSCSVVVSKSPVHIIGSAKSKKICGTASNPWIIEAPIGQNINIFLLSFADDGKSRSTSQPCLSRGVIVDKPSKKNTTICVDGKQREKHLYSSSTNKVEIYTTMPEKPAGDIDSIGEFIIKLEAVGCLDIIPPEDTWLKRNGNNIVVGCYTSRQSWQLNCLDGRWLGVVGNCSKEHLSSKTDPKEESQTQESLSDSEQVLAIVGICGFTLAICLAVGSVGLLCLRRYHRLSKRNLDYKSLTYTTATVRTHRSDGQIVLGQSEYNQNVMANAQQEPFYSVYAGRISVNETDGVIGVANQHTVK